MSKMKAYYKHGLSGLVASDTAPGYDVDNLLIFLEGSLWKGVGTGDHTITHDAGHGKLVNGDFETGDTSGWTFATGGGASATFTASSSSPYQGTYKGLVTITNPGTLDGHIQVYQSGKSIVAAKRYKIIFAAKAAAPRVGRVDLIKSDSPFNSYTDEGTQIFHLTNSWKIFEITFTANITAENARLQITLGVDIDDVELDVVGWYEEDDILVDYAGAVNHNLSGATYTLQHSMDGFVSDINDFVSFSPSDNLPFLKELTGLSRRYTRIKLTNLTAVPFMARAYWGNLVEWDFPALSDPNAEEDQAVINESETGYLLGINIKFIKQILNVKFTGVLDGSATWLAIRAWWENHGRRLLFISWDIENRPNDIYFVKPDKSFKGPFISAVYRDVDIKFDGRVSR